MLFDVLTKMLMKELNNITCIMDVTICDPHAVYNYKVYNTAQN